MHPILHGRSRKGKLAENGKGSTKKVINSSCSGQKQWGSLGGWDVFWWKKGPLYFARTQGPPTVFRGKIILGNSEELDGGALPEGISKRSLSVKSYQTLMGGKGTR